MLLVLLMVVRKCDLIERRVGELCMGLLLKWVVVKGIVLLIPWSVELICCCY